MSGDRKPPALTKMEAMRALIAWADSNETAQALEALELLQLDDDDVEALFRRSGKIVRIPHLGKVR